jgi:putative addiction module CopG family antidote
MTMATSYSIGKPASEIMRDGLRLIEEREQRREAKLEWLRAAIQEGLDSPVEEVDIHEWMEDVKRRGRQRLAVAAGIDDEQDKPTKVG